MLRQEYAEVPSSEQKTKSQINIANKSLQIWQTSNICEKY